MAKIRKDLIGSVLVDNPQGGDPIVLVAGDKVPDGIELGDHVLDKKSEKLGDETINGAGKAARKAAKKAAAPQGAAGDGALEVPKLVGAGSSTDAWRAYATKATAAAGLQVDIPADAKRADIIEALKGAGIATE